MPKVSARTYSRYSLEAMRLLGNLIRIARKERRMTAQELADRAGISRGLVQRIENGDPRCELGATFEVASLVGLKLFDPEATTLTAHIRQTEDKLALLPKSVRKKVQVADDDF
jgi:transcriptional regulator with XRE-family HTH domain